MRVIPGAPRTPTPELRTTLDYVRFNPTWTMPASIMREPVWRTRLADPAWLRRNGFNLSNGRAVQQPGPLNAMGLVKFGLNNAGAIFLHDTNDRAKFGDGNEHFASFGCVRVERPFALAAWILGLDEEDAVIAQRRGDRRDQRDFSTVSVVLSYLTAWPSGDGRLSIHRDIYRRDGRPIHCARTS